MRTTRVALAGLCLLLLGTAPGAPARARAPGEGGPRKMTVYLHGKALSLRIYDPPAGAPRQSVQVLVTSGDLGWLGISGDVPGYLQERGYRVVGLNAQSYEVAFTGPHGAHLDPAQIARDFDTIMEAVSADGSFPAAFVSIGVSEGAGLAVMAMGQPGASTLCRGVIGLGLPVRTALAWRWTDFPSWITKAEPHEAEAATEDYLVRLRVPLVVIHSLHDEYDAIDKVRAIVARAPVPTRFIPVDAPNHRFSRHTRQVLELVDSSITWIDSLHRADAAATAR